MLKSRNYYLGLLVILAFSIGIEFANAQVTATSSLRVTPSPNSTPSNTTILSLATSQSYATAYLDINCPDGVTLKGFDLPLDTSAESYFVYFYVATGTPTTTVTTQEYIGSKNISAISNYAWANAFSTSTLNFQCESDMYMILEVNRGGGSASTLRLMSTAIGSAGNTAPDISITNPSGNYVTSQLLLEYATAETFNNTLAPSLPEDYNTSMPPYKFATSSCVTVDNEEVCLHAYKPEIYYHDWALATAFILFFLGLSVTGIFLSRMYNSKKP